MTLMSMRAKKWNVLSLTCVKIYEEFWKMIGL